MPAKSSNFTTTESEVETSPLERGVPITIGTGCVFVNVTHLPSRKAGGTPLKRR
jgi:hypothetical protein